MLFRAGSTTLLVWVSLAATAGSQQPLDTQLLANPGFETGDISGWTPTTSAQTLVGGYGVGGGLPSFNVSIATQAGLYLLTDNGSGVNARIQQAFDLTGNTLPLDVVASGYFGSQDLGDVAHLRVSALNGAGATVAELEIGGTSGAAQNGENVMLRDQGRLSLPVSAETLLVEVRFTRLFGTGSNGLVDSLDVQLTAPSAPLPPPLDLQLLANADFESGWSATSPLDLNDPDGWRGVSASTSVRLGRYGLSDAPSFEIRSEIGGGLFALMGNNNGSIASLQQEVDLSLLATLVNTGQLSVHLAGFFGCNVAGNNNNDRGRLTAEFYNPIGAFLGSVSVGDDVADTARNGEAVLMRREGVFRVPLGAARMRLLASVVRPAGTVANGALDNLECRLVATQAPAPLPLNSELVTNGDFESGWLANSPLNPSDASGWFRTGGSRLEVGLYPSGMPTSVQQAIGGGQGYLRETGANGSLAQDFDLTGNAQAVDTGILGLQLSAFLGSRSSDSDHAVVTVSFFDEFGAVLGSAQTGGPIGSAAPDLLANSMVETIPPFSRSMRIRVQMVLVTGSFGGGAVDNVSAFLFDTTVGGSASYPGTQEDLLLFSGISGQLATTGPLNERKTAAAGDYLTIRMTSPGQAFWFSPYIVAVNLLPAGVEPAVVIPGIAVDSAYPLLLIDSFGPTGPLLSPNGTELVFGLPSALLGSSLLVQGFVIPSAAPPPFAPLPAANGVWASCDGHRIEIQ